MSLKQQLVDGTAGLALNKQKGNDKTSVNTQLIDVNEKTIKDELEAASNELSETKSVLSEVISEKQSLEKKLADLEDQYKNSGVGLEEYESRLAELNVSLNEPIDPQTLTPHPVYHNRTAGYFKLTIEQEAYFDKYIVQGEEIFADKEDHGEDIESDSFTKTSIGSTSDRVHIGPDSSSNVSLEHLTSDRVHIDKFFSLVISIYKAGKNNTAICYTEEEIDGEKILCPIFGESRWQAVKWLHSKGYKNNGSNDIVLIGFRSNTVESLKFKEDRLSENTGRIDLAPIELGIQVYDLYDEYEKNFKQGAVAKTKFQRPEGYAINEIHHLIKKSHASVKKYKQIGDKLGPYFSDTLGIYANYVSYSSLTRLAAIFERLNQAKQFPELKDLIDNEVKRRDFDAYSLNIAEKDKTKFISNICAVFIKQHASKSPSNSDAPHSAESRKSVKDSTTSDSRIDTSTITVESIQGIKLTLTFKESDIKSKNLSKLLQDPDKVEAALNDFIHSHT